MNDFRPLGLRHARVVLAENGWYHRICLEILPRPCIFQIPAPRENKSFFFQAVKLHIGSLYYKSRVDLS